jgi:preprotein translocase subunit YajC
MNERKKMNATLEVGQTYTTTQSGITGIVKAIDNHPSGVNRILLDVNGKERWTSAPAN